MMKILAIESSCDETAIAILEFTDDITDNKNIKVLSSVISSQIDIHKEYGGVVPEIASRQHVKSIGTVLDKSLKEAGCELSEIDAIAVTAGPGLIGALLVGVSFAKALAYSLNIPIVPVHHIAGHIAANYLSNPELKPPYASLVVSGGHSHVILVNDYTEYKILAKTRDDAAGEAFDKVARVLGLGYPGGPEVSKLAKTGEPTYVLPKTKFDENFDYSFSGVKTAVMNIVNNSKEGINIPNMCASFEKNITEVLVSHAIDACKKHGIEKIALAGGVSANTALRDLLVSEGKRCGISVYLPELKYTTDNAAMIGCAGIKEFLKGNYTNDLSLNAKASKDIEGK